MASSNSVARSSAKTRRITHQKQAAHMLALMKFDGLAYMVDMLRQPGIEEKSRVKLSSELTSYQYPKLKSVEHVGEGGGPLVINIKRWGIAGDRPPGK